MRKVALTNPKQHPPDESVHRMLNQCDAVLEATDCVSRDEVIALCADADADVVLVGATRIDAQSIRSMERCRTIVRIGTGYDNIDIEAGISVANVPEFCTEEVADHTFALLLALERKLIAGDRLLRAGMWDQFHLMPATEPATVRQILEHVGERTTAPAIAPALTTAGDEWTAAGCSARGV